MQLAVLALCIIGITSYDYWDLTYSAFTSDYIDNNEEWSVQGNNVNFNSTCNGVALFGGYNVFGSGASVSKIISLPTHFKLRVSLEFWKIDSWDDEILYIILDNSVTTGTWFWNTGDALCGNPTKWEDWREVKTIYTIEFAHNEPTLAVVITTNLDEVPLTVFMQYYKESWGFRNFQVEVLHCAPGCVMCNDDTPDECWYYGQIEKNWFDIGNFNTDGWTLDTYQLLTYSKCSNIQVLGGIGSFTGSTQLSKQYTLDPHIKVILQVQLWKFDIWISNEFTIEIDGQSIAKELFNQYEITQICGDSNGGEKLVNIQIVLPHTSDSMQIKMKSNLTSTLGSWGLRAFSLFIGKCYTTCLTCSGPKVNDCQTCKTGYIFHNSECVDVKWILGLQQYFQPQDFQIQAGWTITNVFNNRSPFQICAGQNLVGGTQLLAKSAQIIFNFDLPRHSKIRVKLQFWKFDSWDTEWFNVYANGILVYQMQFGLNGVLISCGSYSTSVYIKDLDFSFSHNQPSINLVLTSNLDELPDNESWGIRDFQLFYGVSRDCSYSVIDSISLPSFVGTGFFQTTYYSTDQTLQNKIEITELGISLQPSFDQTLLSFNSAIKKLTILITWNCFLNDQVFSISILQSSYPDYKTQTVICKQKQSNILQSTLILQRTIIQESELRLIATPTLFQILQTVDGQLTKQFEMIIN